MTSVAEPGGLTWVQTVLSDPLVLPMLRELDHEYTSRYGQAAHGEMARFPAEEFAPPHGVLVLLLEHGVPVAGGAFRRYDETTAELKRIWTHSAHRRRGLAVRVVGELERIAAVRGYRRIRLTTGPRQPEARGLYLTTGYTPLFDTSADPETIGLHSFEKRLTDRPGGPPAGRPADRSAGGPAASTLTTVPAGTAVSTGTAESTEGKV